MKWLLVTTRYTNPGDEFARMGVQCAIRAADPRPEFILLNKETPEDHAPQEFDRAVVCGMPLFWSLPATWAVNDCRLIDWWKPLIRGWISENRSKFAAIGVGDVMTPDWHPARPVEFEEAVREAEHRAAFVTLRAPLGVEGPRVSCCPSAFAFMDFPPASGSLRLCNFMPNGGHFYHPHDELLAWRSKERALSDLLRSRNFHFVAHTVEEKFLAESLGWPVHRTFFRDAHQTAEVYKSAGMFIGNRVHGGAVCAARGVPSWVVTYDSRLRMAERLGARTYVPSALSLSEVSSWIDSPTAPRPQVDIREEFDWTVNRLKQFMQ